MNKRQILGFATAAWLWRLMLVAGLLSILPARAEMELPTLHTKRGTYTNVVVTARTETDLHIRHAAGISNVKLVDIEDDNALVALGLKAPPLKPATESAETNETVSLTNAPAGTELASQQYQKLALEKLEELKKYRPPFKVWSQILAAILVVYLFGCYCLKLICEKAGHEPGVLVWLPVLHAIPAFRAAGMSAWWVLALFVPLLNLVVQIIWCFKITSARHKSFLVAILLLLPILNLFAFLYLAFSGTEE